MARVVLGIILFAAGAVPGYVYASHLDSLFIEDISAIRISDTAITLSFITEESSMATVRYTDSGSANVTFTDTTPQIDHLFTISELEPSKQYTFTLTAAEGDFSSNRYVVSLVPESIGEPGQRITPGYQEITESGVTVTSTLSASSSKNTGTKIPPWVVVSTAVTVTVLWFGYRLVRWYRLRRTQF